VGLGFACILWRTTALQSRINGELSNQMGGSLEGALVSFGTGLVALN